MTNSEWNKIWNERVRHYFLAHPKEHKEWLNQVKAEGDKMQEQLQDCSGAHKILYNNSFKIPELQQKLVAIQEIYARCNCLTYEEYDKVRELLS